MVHPDCYGLVEKGIFRSITLQPGNFSIFKHIKNVVLLSPEAPSKALMVWMDDSKIAFRHLGYQQISQPNNFTVSEELIKEGLEMLLDLSLHPILVMCCINNPITYFTNS
jgi:hypothetical protein